VATDETDRLISSTKVETQRSTTAKASVSGRLPDRPRDEATIDFAVDDSFPASDPPCSGGATAAGASVLAGGGNSGREAVHRRPPGRDHRMSSAPSLG
jgi:hypothetical protein